jgi:hypothetical protein
MSIIKHKIIAISTLPTKPRAKQRASVHLQKKLRADAHEAPKTGCPDPGLAGFDFSEDDAGRVMRRTEGS